VGLEDIHRNIDIAKTAFGEGAQSFYESSKQYGDTATEITSIKDALAELYQRVTALNPTQPTDFNIKGFKAVARGVAALQAAAGEAGAGDAEGTSLQAALAAATLILDDESINATDAPALAVRDRMPRLISAFAAMDVFLEGMNTRLRDGELSLKILAGGVNTHIIDRLNEYDQ
jgi:hypothetical protein